MIDGPTRERLEVCVRRESRSLFQYVREVPMWSGPADQAASIRLRQLAQAELDATNLLARWLQKRRTGQLHLGPFPSVYTNNNDAALHYILPRVVLEHGMLLADLERDAAATTDPDARSLVDAMLIQKRKNAPDLASLSAKPHTTFK